MNNPASATRVVARFEIPFTRHVDADGLPCAPLPAWAEASAPLVALYRRMVQTRSFDRKAVALQRTGRLGTYASCLGQEAVGTAIGDALAPDDILIPAYRDAAAQFARGMPLHHALQYWGGDERGMAHPPGTPAFHDFPNAVPIATQVPQAIGVAYALRYRREPRVVLAICGDGATSKGDFYEAISAAKLWDLPVVFVVVNNGWAISQPVHRQTGAATLAQKAIAGGLPGEQVDGNDVIACRTVLGRVIERARSGAGPALVEALSYRLHDHTTADDARRYRDEAEVQAAWTRCPILRLRRLLERRGDWTEADEQALLAEAAAGAEAAAQRFLALPPAPPDAMFEHRYATLPRSYAAQRDELRRRGPETPHG